MLIPGKSQRTFPLGGGFTYSHIFLEQKLKIFVESKNGPEMEINHNLFTNLRSPYWGRGRPDVHVGKIPTFFRCFGLESVPIGRKRGCGRIWEREGFPP